MTYEDITRELVHEPIMKNGRLFIRLHFDDALIATIDHKGNIQRQAPKTFKVFWDMGVLMALKLIVISDAKEAEPSDALMNRGFTKGLAEGIDKAIIGDLIQSDDYLIKTIQKAIDDGKLFVSSSAVRRA